MANIKQEIMDKLWIVRELIENGEAKCDGDSLNSEACEDALNDILRAYDALIETLDYYIDEDAVAA